MIPSLPLEVIRHISKYLTHREFYQLIMVNRLFYDKFIMLLYTNVAIDGQKRFDLFKQTARYHHHVRRLRLSQITYCKRDIRRLRSSMTSLHSLDIQKRQGFTINECTNYFSNITSLCIRSLSNKDSILSVLSCLCLKSLSLYDLERLDITTDLVQDICRSQPLLESLFLEGKSAKSPAGPISTSAEPTHGLKVLAIYVKDGMNHDYPWLDFVRIHYPGLTCLTFENYGGWQADDDDQPVSPDDPYAFTHNEEDSTIIYRQFLLGCPRLKKIHLRRAESNALFLQELQQHPLLSVSTSRVMEYNPLSRACLFNLNPSLSIIDLSITLADTLSSAQLVQDLGKACPQLRRLQIGHEHSSAGFIQINTLLLSLPCLTSLTLYGAEVSLKEKIKTQRRHPLREIRFFDTELRQSGFECIDRFCAHVNYLTLTRCHFTVVSTETGIYLPNQHLCRVELIQTTYDRIVERNPPLKTKLERLTGRVNCFLDVSIRQRSQKWLKYKPSPKDDVAENNVPMVVNTVGCIDLTCQSIHILLVNGKRKL